MAVTRPRAVSRRPARRVIALAALALLLCGGCGLFERINEQAYRSYHESRMRALAEAYATGTRAEMPMQPGAPRVCEEGVAPAYAAVGDALKDEREAWDELLKQSVASVASISALLDALAARDVIEIEKLAARLPAASSAHKRAESEWRQKLLNVQAGLSELEAQWRLAWPAEDLSFELAALVQQARLSAAPAPDSARAAKLTQYHDNEYDRLAMVYLGYEPEREPEPDCPVPAGCEGIAAAQQRLEGGLLARFNLDEAVERDAAIAAKAASVDPKTGKHRRPNLESEKLAETQAAISYARLELFSRLDALLTSCLDAQQRAVQMEWLALWPQSDMETNIFAYAHLDRAQSPPVPLEQLLAEGQEPADLNGNGATPAPAAGSKAPDPLRDLSFRQ